MKNRIAQRFVTLAGPADSLRGQLVRGGVGSFAVKVGHTVLTFLVAVILARVMGPDGYGVYAFAFSLISLLAIPAQMGLPVLVVRETAKYHYQKRWGVLRGLLRRVNQLVLGFSLLLGLVAAGIAGFLSMRADPVQIETFLWALLLVPLIALGNLRGAALRGLHRVVQGQLPEMVLQPGLFFLLIGMVGLLSTLTPQNAMALHALAAMLAFAIGAVLLWRAMPAESRMVTPEYETREWARSVLPLSLLVGVQVINGQAGIVILGLFASSEEVGIYRVAFQGGNLVAFSLAAVGMVIGPHVARLYTSGDRERLQQMATWSARAILLVALPVAGIFILFGAPILAGVFGSEYRAGHTALAILCTGHLFKAAMGSVILLLNMTGHERDSMKGVAAAAVSNLVLGLMLIPLFGMNGAAMATAIAFMIWNLILYRQVWNRLGIQSTAFWFRPAG